jgi:hypothetical protein
VLTRFRVAFQTETAIFVLVEDTINSVDNSGATDRVCEANDRTIKDQKDSPPSRKTQWKIEPVKLHES